MASHGHHVPSVQRPSQPSPYNIAMAASHAPPAPAGTFAPGTKIQVGSHRVVIQKYLSEGGFAHVYLVKLPKPLDGTDLAVLKRVAVPDKDSLRGMRTEVETMKRLKGHRPIVTYIDSHASELRGGGYEVFLLMEYCNGGGLIDFMNTRLQHRLTEPEILHIFSDVAEGVACMHYLKPPLLHRDLKVENVLILSNGSSKRFKLCDFGSASAPKPAPHTVAECRAMDEDVQKHTTLQYRSPEMVDVYKKQPIDEKSDIWALGVLLYKLCYYTTPFEDQGQLAILNASYRFHSHPVFSDRLKRLIASMLRENQQARPNIYEVVREACAMQGRQVPIQDIYSGRAHSEPRSSDKAPLGKESKSAPMVGAVFSPPPVEQQVIPEIVPMRRGRLPAASHVPDQKPSPSPGRVTSGDPFAALDTRPTNKDASGDLSSRFPSLDQFSLFHDQGTKFEFDSPNSPPGGQPNELNQKVTEHLADEAFASLRVSDSESSNVTRPKSVAQSQASVGVSAATTAAATALPTPGVDLKKTTSAPAKPSEMSRASAIITRNPELQAISSQTSHKYVSTGTMTSDSLPAPEKEKEAVPIWRVPSTDKYSSSSSLRPAESNTSSKLRSHDSQPQLASSTRPSSHTRHPSSSRPSLEGVRPSAEYLSSASQRQSPTASGQRPVSGQFESSLDYLRERQKPSKPLLSRGSSSPKYGTNTVPSTAPDPEEDLNIESNVEFLRSMEESNGKKERLSWHAKRSSVNSTSGSKNIFGGKFGDAFKRFEGQQPPSADPSRTPSPTKYEDNHGLTPIAGSVATDGRSEGDQGMDDENEMTPEMRREIERRQLAEEERRVEAAQAEYRQRVASKGPGSTGRPAPPPKSAAAVSKAASIQNRVQSLLEDGKKSSTQIQRTAEGYGVYSDAATAASRANDQQQQVPRSTIARRPVGAPAKPRPLPPTNAGQDIVVHKLRHPATDPTSNSTSSRPTPGAKPTAPRKPTHLSNLTSNANATQPTTGTARTQEYQVATNLPGQPALEMTGREKEDYIQDFSKRFPSLGTIEMVERDISTEAVGERSGR